MNFNEKDETTREKIVYFLETCTWSELGGFAIMISLLVAAVVYAV